MKKIWLICLASLVYGAAQAATETTTVTSVTTSTTVPATKADLDAEISDAKLRAESGSKSKFSASFTATYSGASAEKPFGKTRPQIGTSDTEDPVSVSGGFGARYRLNKHESLYFATGYNKELHTTDSKMDISNPLISYNNTFAADDLQIGTALTQSFTTNDRQQKIGNFGTTSARISAVSDLNQSGLKGGIFAYVLYTYYRSGFEKFEAGQIDYAFNAGPNLTYRMNDKFNVYTNIMALSLAHFKNKDDFDMESGDVTESIGVGYSPVRDVYLAPYASFYWNQFSARKTAVNFSATINIF